MPIDYNGLFASIAATGRLLGRLDAVRAEALPAWLDDLARSAPGSDVPDPSRAQAGLGSLASALRSRAQADLVAAVDAGEGLSSRTVPAALEALAAAMRRDGRTVARSTCTLRWRPDPASSGAPAMVGTAALAEAAFSEEIRFTSAVSALIGRGDRAVPDPTDPAYPAGSGYSGSVPVCDAAGSGGQILDDGEFDRWTVAGLPAAWRTLGSGVSRSSLDYSGADALQFTGDGTERTAVYQPLPGLAAGSLLAVNLFARLAAGPAPGVLEVSLRDASGVTVSGVLGPCAASRDLSGGLDAWGASRWGAGAWGASTGGGEWGGRPWGALPWGSGVGAEFAPFGALFALPDPIPQGGLALAIRLSVPLPPGVRLQVDRAAACAPTLLYAGGPSVAFFSGASAPRSGDRSSLFAENDRQGFLTAQFDRLFGAGALGLLPPSSRRPDTLSVSPHGDHALAALRASHGPSAGLLAG